ncbi:type 3 dihydrofolate reductase [Aeromonas dhakensis]|uniref:type 3 dihydrofolate reductase n=1 Tax=Aeromonas dhakensis TaxID=196024 RepID=UPI00227A2F70|nr:type 3 dihydrofolate reductase [Aeromonas dhakensis]WAF68768.1 type 3 dihydrofolate reductase [Aeromonas dhakensis]
MKISMIAAVAHDRVIGKDNQMPWHMPADLAHFKRITLGKPVLMGRKTYESIGRPLPGRRNLVISRNPDYRVDGVEVIDSVSSALELLGREDSVEELMVIGGGHLFEQLLPRAERLYLTQIELEVDGDAHFPVLDHTDWELLEEESHPADERNAYPYRFETWQRR